MSKKIKLRTSFMQEMSQAYTQGAETTVETINVLEQMAQALNGEELSEAEIADITRMCNQTVIPLLQSVQLRYNLLSQKIDNRIAGKKSAPFNRNAMVQSLTHGEETVQGTLGLLNSLSEGLQNDELIGDEAQSIEQTCREKHVPALQGILTEFSDLQQKLQNVNGNGHKTDDALKQQLATAFNTGHTGVGQTADFLVEVADKITNEELTGDEAETLESVLRNPLIPALQAVTEKLNMLNQEVLATM